MNFCSFTGFLTEDPKLIQVDGVSQTEFVLVTYIYRKTKSTGEKSRMPTFIKCEAWHTGAETICKLGKKGSKLHVHATAKNASKNSREVIFRISEFDFASPLDETPS